MFQLTRLTQRLRRLVTRPADELTGAQRSLRFALNLTRYCAGQLAGNRAPQMAAALTYRTLFSLVPMAVLALLVFRSFVGMDSAQTILKDTAYDYLGLSALALPPAEPNTAGEAAPGSPADPIPEDSSTQTTAIASVTERIDQLVKDAWELKLGSIGVVGLLLLIWAALALVVTVEQCFNFIYNCPSGRPWRHRITIYWTVITLGPVLLFVSLYLAGNLFQWIQAQELPLLGTVAGWFTRFTALGASWLLLFVIYFLLPNTRIHLRPALIGSLAAATLWESGKWGFKLYVTRVVPYSAVYGSLALIPLFLFWLYITWLVVLFGLQLAYTLQAMSGQKFEIDERRQRQWGLDDPRRLISIMAMIGKTFARGQPISTEEMSQKMLIPVQAIAQMGEFLEQQGLVHRIEETKKHRGGYSLAVPPSDIPVAKLLELGHALANGSDSNGPMPGAAMLDQMYQAQQDAAGNATLATLIENTGASEERATESSNIGKD